MNSRSRWWTVLVMAIVFAAFLVTLTQDPWTPMRTYQNTPRRIPDHLRGSSTSAGGVNNGARGVNNGAGGVNNGAGGVNNGAGGVNNGAGGVNNGAGGVNNGDGFVMFALRTTRRNHAERLPVLLDTWMTKAAPGQVHVFSDEVRDSNLRQRLDDMGNRLHSTAECVRPAAKASFPMKLCCKTGEEHRLFAAEVTKQYRWFCHVDDDMYINLPVLYKELGRYSSGGEKVYFGRMINHRLKNMSTLLEPNDPRRAEKFYLMYGGFYCLSRALVEATRQYFAGGVTMQQTCAVADESDDTTIGAVIGFLIPDAQIVSSTLVHHHVKTDPLSDLPANTIHLQATVSYGFGNRPVFQDKPNLINVPNALFSLEEDPTRLRSYHCLLYPEDEMCARQ